MKFFFVFSLFFLIFFSPCEGAESRVIILGFDGVDPELLERFMEEGKLPNLAALRESGTYLPLGTTLPPQSPVSWAGFATGMNPAKTRIFDFLMRTPGSYYPDFAMIRKGTIRILPHPFQRFLVALIPSFSVFIILSWLRRGKRDRWFLSIGALFFFLAIALLFLRWIPKEIPKPLPGREGASFWKRASENGVPSVLIRVPVTFPPETLSKGRLLSGLGVPDIRKSFGTFSFYTTEAVDTTDTEMGGKIIPVRIEGGKIRTFVWGPKNFTEEGEPDLFPELHLMIDSEKKHLTLQFQGQSYTVPEGEWSPWVTFRFDLNPLLHLNGIGRFYVKNLSPFQLYLSPIHFHPARIPPNFSLSSPRHFSKELSESVGLFKTLGWMQETWGLNEGRLDEEAFLEDLSWGEAKLKEIFFHELARPDWRLFVGVFEATDRAQHMFWRTIDPDHPAHDKEEAKNFGDVILRTYEEMDRTVGGVLRRFVDPETILFVLSDHGFHSFRKSVHLNTWLVQNGYMTLKGVEEVRDRNLEDLFGQGEFWPNVDWSRTKAYALGLAGLYINRRGREPEGIVSEEDYEGVRSRLKEDLLALQDPETEEFPLLRVYRREEVYSGPYLEETPDLILGFREGYRVSWQTALGGIPKDIFEVNTKKWSGDHCSYDPSITHGVFLCNRHLSQKTLHILDIAPTVLEIFQVPIPSDIDGRSFWTEEGAKRREI